MTEHWFWFLLTCACVVWYSTITIYVAFKGTKDIRGMLERLNKKKSDRELSDSEQKAEKKG